LVEEGLGDGFTDQQGYEQVRQLIGPSEYVLKRMKFLNAVEKSQANDTPVIHGLIQKSVSSCAIRSPTYSGH
jgi:hypothetical protein